MFVVFTKGFDSGEVAFDEIEIGRVRGQEKEGGIFCRDQFLRFGGFVERDVVPDHDVVLVQPRTKMLFQPGSENLCIRGSLKQERCFKGFANPRGNERGSRPSVS